MDRISVRLALGARCLLTLSAWAGLVCLLLIAFDGIPDTEQFAGILVVAPHFIAGIDPAERQSNRTVGVSLSPPSAYLAFLLRSPPAIS